MEQEAYPNRPVAEELLQQCRSLAMATRTHNKRALYIAAAAGNIELVRVLLERDHADPNATDITGRTALLSACEQKHPCIEVVRLLLEAGADATMAYENGLTPLHLVAHNGHMDLVDMLFLRTPGTLSQCAAGLGTPLCFACSHGNENMASKLLSLGAIEPVPPRDRNECPLVIAVTKGFIGVVRILVEEGAMKAVGGHVAMAMGLHAAIECRKVVMFRFLLAVGRLESRLWRLKVIINGMTLVHLAARYCYPAAMSVLLQAGVDETAQDSDGCTPRDVIGLSPHEMDPHQMDPREEVAVRRMLDQGPAYRARSWAWPVDGKAEAGSSGHGDGGSATGAVLSSLPATKIASVVNVRIFVPKKGRSSKFFASLIGRYCAKD